MMLIHKFLPQKKKNLVRTPTLIQMEAVECGAASLGIILGYFGRIVPLAKLRQECGVSRDGVKASNILKTARLYGFNAKGFKKSLASLQELQPPYIVFWNFNHFLVVEGFEQDLVYLSDPASGRRTITMDEFDQGYTGVVLVLEPTENFEKGGTKPSVIGALNRRLANSRLPLMFALIAGLLLTIPRLAIPAFSQIFIDEILIENRQTWLRPLIIAMILTAIIQGWLTLLRSQYLRKLLIKLSVVMNGQFIWHTLRLPVGFYAQRFSGEISNRSSLNDRVAEVLSGELATTIIDAMMMVFYAVIMLLYDWVLTLVVIGFAAINIIALQTLSRVRVDANQKLSQEKGKLGGIAIGGLLSMETIKASGLESDLFSKFAGYHAKAINAEQELSLQSQTLTLLPTLLTALSVAAILILGGLRVMNGSLSIGMLIAFQSLSTSFLEPVNTLVNFGSTLQILEADLNRLEDVLANPVDQETERSSQLPMIVKENLHNDSSQTRKSPLFELQGYVEVKNLTFGYNRLDKPLIEDLSFYLQPGQRVALVGGSGSGKSTVAKLICGLYQPWSGEILFDNIRRSQVPRSVLANSLAMVEQDIFLFAGTVQDNLSLWDSTVSQADVIQACQDAAIHELILSIPGGYNGTLIEGGMNLSGGQRQRLEIARALVRNPAVLVLDEATSALDAETELIIDRNLRRRGCSCIVVAHRLSTIRDCDEIIMLEQGRVLQRGTHDQLKTQGGAYAHLLDTETQD